ncbi:Alpha/beta hydrolase family protein [Rubripirellula lacrimiformis]|uniref:Alpha/beta hydrolase family protein n=1 Tax=Rubripirellula lacrimiformis TaxID=1930273 RepID=A0A517N9I4_9BACT|nr:Alpha/beta hydrolase family protein [Rubripirellula lacrimiformis]
MAAAAPQLAARRLKAVLPTKRPRPHPTSFDSHRQQGRTIKILFLHGWNSVTGGRKPSFLADAGHEVFNPALPDEDFDQAVRIAEAELVRHQPDVIVGSSRGGAVAINMNSGRTPLVLLCPAWKRWGTVTSVSQNTIILHSPQDDVIPLTDSQSLISNSGLPPTSLIEIGTDHRLADPQSLATMLDACLGFRPRVMGADFGAPRKAGDQAKKIILMEAIRLGDKKYAIEATGRNRRLTRPFDSKQSWKHNRRGWTLPELSDSLESDCTIRSAAFDFPFSIPIGLLNDPEFAARLGQPVFRTRDRWVRYVSDQLALRFANENAGAEMTDLAKFTPWKDKDFWQRRCTDTATQGSPPLKHLFQNVFSMTICGAALLGRLSSDGYCTLLDTANANSHRSIFETYPREVANRIGFRGSYKSCPEACLEKALEYLQNRNIDLIFDSDIRHFCETYRTSSTDPDGADAFLCLVASICESEGISRLCRGTANASTLRQEGAIIVPAAIE